LSFGSLHQQARQGPKNGAQRYCEESTKPHYHAGCLAAAHDRWSTIHLADRTDQIGGERHLLELAAQNLCVSATGISTRSPATRSVFARLKFKGAAPAAIRWKTLT
jgi:hypothetical protein